MENVKKGTKFIVIKDFPTDALTSWAKPYTGSEKCVIPKQTIMVADSDQIQGSRGFGVKPEKYEQLEGKLISAKTLEDNDYSGYHFVFLNEDYGRYFIYEDASKNDPSQYASGERIAVKNVLDIRDNKTFKSIKNPTSEDIEKAVTSFINNNSQSFVPGYIMLTKPNVVDNITVYSKENGFYFESQEGAERYKSSRFLKANEIIKILLSYVDGTDEWMKFK